MPKLTLKEFKEYLYSQSQEAYFMPFYNAAKNFLWFAAKNNLLDEFGEDARKLVEYEQDFGSDLPVIYSQHAKVSRG